MPLAHDDAHGFVGARTRVGGGRALRAELPEITCPTATAAFSLRSLRGTKVFVIAWASW